MENVHHVFFKTQGDVSKLGFGLLARQNKKQSYLDKTREAANCHIWGVGTVKYLAFLINN